MPEEDTPSRQREYDRLRINRLERHIAFLEERITKDQAEIKVARASAQELRKKYPHAKGNVEHRDWGKPR